MTDKPSTMERLLRARSSDDLTIEADHAHDVDYVAAAGMAVSSLSRKTKVGAAVLGIGLQMGSGGSVQAAREALRAVTSLVNKLNHKRRWRLDGAAVKRVAEHALLHHLSPRCPVCNGTAWELVPGTKRLSNRPCKACDGSGMRPLDRRNRPEVAAVLAELSSIEDLVEHAVRSRLR